MIMMYYFNYYRYKFHCEYPADVFDIMEKDLNTKVKIFFRDFCQ
jgi:hypothetical protein